MSLVKADLTKEYEKNKGLKREDVLKLAEWLQKQPHLPQISELELIIFLNSCYYSQEAAKTCIDNYYTVRTHCPEFFANKIPDALKTCFDIQLFTLLPGTTQLGYRVMYCKLMDSDPDKYVFANQLKGFVMTSDLWLAKEGTAEGHILLVDMDGVVFGHLTKLGLMTMKKFMYYLQEAMPVRLKGFHFINVVPFMDKILAIMKPFMKKSLIDVMELHVKADDAFYKHVPQKLLPKEYGGESGSIKELHEKMKKDVFKNAQFFKEEEKNRVNENLRPGKAKNAGELFGVEGSFKKLDID